MSCLMASVALVISALLVAGQPNDEVTIDGDAELLGRIVAQQKANLTLYPKGRLQATVIADDRASRTRLVHRFEYGITLAWDGDQTAWDYNERHLINEPGPKLGDGQRRTIETPGKLITYFVGNDVFVSTDPRIGYDRALKQRPELSWYANRHLLPWHEILDPNGPLYQGQRRTYTIKKLDEDRVQIEKRLLDEDATLTVVVSLGQGSNLLSFESVDRQERRTSDDSGSYEWVRNGQGQLFLKRSSAVFKLNLGNGDTASHEETVDVTGFDANPDLPEDQFKLAGVGAPVGTRVFINEPGSPQRFAFRIGDEGAEEY